MTSTEPTAANHTAEWEAEIKLRRNGRLVKKDFALAETAEQALYLASNDLELWTQSEARDRWPKDGGL